MAEKYEELNKVLSDIEVLLLQLAEQKDLKERGTTRWHWDAPDVMVSWKEGDLHKNIHALILEDERIKIECNACKDEDREEGRVRKYNCNEVSTVAMGRLDEIKYSLARAYEEVASWKEENLTLSYFY